MIARLIDYWGQRSMREKRLIAMMLTIAVPLLLWLLVARPLNGALANAKERQAEAVARHGRILARIDAIDDGTSSDSSPVNVGSLDLFVAEAASQRGLTIDSNSPQGSDAVSVRIAHARPEALVEWLLGFEKQGIVVAEMHMTANADGSVALDAQLRRSGT